ncbi:BCCT family transporter [Parvularcula maris]|uniref:BCCT family transporter n=1 Tax=Parvularcula maris TaxID=2965077 RepID=A0A9X2L8D6_9PROT|nr:BCCT family transporter [Parvularcula maris]MCQ8184824.1 BCCT family transporter [Parvularcula maris]
MIPGRGRGVALALCGATLLAVLIPSGFAELLTRIASFFLSVFGGWTLLLANLCLLFCAAVCMLPWGRQVIGGTDKVPEFRMLTWIAMMFAAGMGAGLVFWGAAEPLIHFASPPPGEGIEPLTDEARRRSLAITQFHWGLHAWAIYAAATIAIALSAKSGKPPLPSTAFPGLPAPAARVVDLIALLAVVFGLVASLGQGAFQVSAGVGVIVPGLEAGPSVQLGFLLLLSAAFLTSAALGLRRGIALLSNVNMVLAGVLLLFLLIVAPAGDVAAALWESAAGYVTDIPGLSVTLRAAGEARAWTDAWSLVYFLWWVAWTPFVGVFLVRISRGRSLRAFVLAAVGAPSLLTLLWFAVLGGAALGLQEGGMDLGVADFATAPLATYTLLEAFPFSVLMQIVTVLLVSFFLVTSADSGAYVIAMFAEQTTDPSLRGRLLFGAVLSLLTLAAILSEGGQTTTRAMAVAGGIPLTALLGAQVVSAAVRLSRTGRHAGATKE